MTDIYKRMEEGDSKFNIMLDDALEKIGNKHEPERINKKFNDDENYIVKWVRPNESYVGPQRYIWVNFGKYMKGLFKDHWGVNVLDEDFYNDFFLPYLKNHYLISNEKEIKLESVLIEKLNLHTYLGDDYDESYDTYKNKKNITMCIVFQKIDSKNKGWINNTNLKETILSFIRYYYHCNETSCGNWVKNEIENYSVGMVKKTCKSCGKSIFVNIKSN